MLWIMGHNLLGDGANQNITVIGLEKGWVTQESVMILSVSGLSVLGCPIRS